MDFTITIPEDWMSMIRWYHLLYLSGAYGFLTHMVSLPAIHRYNKKLTADDRRELTPLKLFGLLLFRIVFALPERILFLVIGVAWIFLSFVSTGIPAIRNGFLCLAWHLVFSPKDIGDIMKTSETGGGW